MHPELMYMMVDRIATGLDDLLEWLAPSPGMQLPDAYPVPIALEAVADDG